MKASFYRIKIFLIFVSLIFIIGSFSCTSPLVEKKQELLEDLNLDGHDDDDDNNSDGGNNDPGDEVYDSDFDNDGILDTFDCAPGDPTKWELSQASVTGNQCVCAGERSDTFAGGDGSVSNPFTICTPEQLNNIGSNSYFLDKHFKLLSDIDLKKYRGKTFNLIGMKEHKMDHYHASPFRGVFDGNNHAILNFSYTDKEKTHIGLFRYAYDAEIKNLTMINPIVNGRGSVGTIAGHLLFSKVKNIRIKNCKVSGDDATGLELDSMASQEYAYIGGLS